MNSFDAILKHKYILFFLLAVLSLFLGLSLWIGVFTTSIEFSNPIDLHTHFMFFGFFDSMVLGFIFTAFPNFTGNEPVSKFKLLLILVLKILGLTFLITSQMYLFSLVWLFELVLVTNYILKNIYSHFTRFPKSFLMVLIGFIWQFIYVLINFFNIDIVSDSSVLKMLLHQAFILNVILGVGLKVLPAMLGIGQSFSIERNSKKTVFKSGIQFLISYKYYFYLIFLNLKFVLDIVFLAPAMNQIFLAIYLMFLVLVEFQLFSKKMQLSYFSLAIKAALFFIVLGIFLTAVDGFYLWGLHIYFISGILLLTFIISGRVILAHGGFGLALEKSDKRLIALVACLVLAMLFRISSYLITWFSYEKSLITAVVIVFLFIILWFSIYGNKLFILLKGEKYVGRKLL